MFVARKPKVMQFVSSNVTVTVNTVTNLLSPAGSASGSGEVPGYELLGLVRHGRQSLGRLLREQSTL